MGTLWELHPTDAAFKWFLSGVNSSMIFQISSWKQKDYRSYITCWNGWMARPQIFFRVQPNLYEKYLLENILYSRRMHISLPFAKAKPQTSHLNGLSPECNRLWDQSEEYRENVPSHTLQWNGFSAWFWLFCLPPEIGNTTKILVFLKGPVLQKDVLKVDLWCVLTNTIHRIMHGKCSFLRDTFKRGFFL